MCYLDIFLDRIDEEVFFYFRWPLLVDPDELGTRWIQQHEASNGLEVIREQDMNMPSSKDVAVTVLEEALARCVPKAIPLLLMDLSADPPSVLHNIISRTTIEEGLCIVILFFFFFFNCVPLL